MDCVATEIADPHIVEVIDVHGVGSGSPVGGALSLPEKQASVAKEIAQRNGIGVHFIGPHTFTSPCDVLFSGFAAMISTPTTFWFRTPCPHPD